MNTLGRFGHHPDPAIDFTVEVEEIEAEYTNHLIGFQPFPAEILKGRVFKAMQFRVGGDPIAVSAKDFLRQLEPRVMAL